MHSASLTTSYTWDATAAGNAYLHKPDVKIDANILPSDGKIRPFMTGYQWDPEDHPRPSGVHGRPEASLLHGRQRAELPQPQPDLPHRVGRDERGRLRTGGRGRRLNCDEFAFASSYNSGGMSSTEGGMNPALLPGGSTPTGAACIGRGNQESMGNHFATFMRDMRIMDKDAYWLDTRMNVGGTCAYGTGGGQPVICKLTAA
ncbi:hypothetical protein [Streptomyces sp. NPDC013489]|uniref:hypothetical protein n=1 Tax=Streptomyces sp. NPDC013489 TaxID=3155606 RepID=UPI0033CF504B